MCLLVSVYLTIFIIWFLPQFQTIKVEEAQNNEALESGKNELKDLQKQKQTLEIQIQTKNNKVSTQEWIQDVQMQYITKKKKKMQQNHATQSQYQDKIEVYLLLTQKQKTMNMNKISISSILKVCFWLVAAHCGANPEKHQNRVWSSPGAIQQDHSWAGAGPHRCEGTGGAAAGRQQKPADC